MRNRTRSTRRPHQHIQIVCCFHWALNDEGDPCRCSESCSVQSICVSTWLVRVKWIIMLWWLGYLIYKSRNVNRAQKLNIQINKTMVQRPSFIHSDNRIWFDGEIFRCRIVVDLSQCFVWSLHWGQRSAGCRLLKLNCRQSILRSILLHYISKRFGQ